MRAACFSASSVQRVDALLLGAVGDHARLCALPEMLSSASADRSAGGSGAIGRSCCVEELLAAELLIRRDRGVVYAEGHAVEPQQFRARQRFRRPGRAQRWPATQAQAAGRRDDD